MILNKIKNAYIRGKPVSKILVGSNLVWTREQSKYIRLYPSVIWISDEISADVLVESNTDWKVK